MNRLLNIVGRVLITILAMLLIGYGWAFFELKIMLKPNPELFGYVFFVETTSDMRPEFQEDDVIIIEKNSEYKNGDKVFYMLEDGTFKVRTVIDNSNVQTNVKCDNCSEGTTSIDKNTIVGKAIAKIRGFNKFIKFFKQKWFLTTLAVVGFLFVILSQYIHEKPKKIS